MKSKMAKIASIGLALVMLLALMSGCTPKEEATPTPQPTPVPEAAYITAYMGPIPLVQELEATFEAKHSGQRAMVSQGPCRA